MFNNNKKRKIMNKSAVFWLSFSPYVSAWPFISELKKYVLFNSTNEGPGPKRLDQNGQNI